MTNDDVKRYQYNTPHWAVANVINYLLGDESDFEKPIFEEPIIGNKFCSSIESDSDHYVAEQIWRKQMRYEESDRYVQMSALQYGI